MFGKRGDDQTHDALAAFGVSAEALPDREEAVTVYPENWTALQAFLGLQTQWRSGMGGREGLIYSEAYAWMSENGITRRKKRQDTMWALRAMENEALRIFDEQRHGGK